MAVIRKLGAKVRQLRQQTGMSQAELAERIGLSKHSRGYISEIEKGKKVPTAETILKIARLFCVTTDFLLRDEIPPESDRAEN